jgi:hypothetical protein
MTCPGAEEAILCTNFAGQPEFDADHQTTLPATPRGRPPATGSPRQALSVRRGLATLLALGVVLSSAGSAAGSGYAMWAREANTGLSYNGSSAPFTETRSRDTLETHKPAA